MSDEKVLIPRIDPVTGLPYNVEMTPQEAEAEIAGVMDEFHKNLEDLIASGPTPPLYGKTILTAEQVYKDLAEANGVSVEELKRRLRETEAETPSS